MPDKSDYLRTSGTFTPDIIEDIQVKAELGRYRIRGFGTLRERQWATFDDLTLQSPAPHPHPARRLPERCSAKTLPRTPLRRRSQLSLMIPIMITGMSLGALSYNAKVALARCEHWSDLPTPLATAGC